MFRDPPGEVLAARACLGQELQMKTTTLCLLAAQPLSRVFPGQTAASAWCRFSSSVLL